MVITRRAKLGISIFVVMIVLAGSFLIHLIGMLQQLYRHVGINAQVSTMVREHNFKAAIARLNANQEYATTNQDIRRHIQARGGLGRLADADSILSEHPKFATSVFGPETSGELCMLQGRYKDAADSFEEQYKRRAFAKAILGSKALAMWRGKIPGSLDVAKESFDDIGHYNVRGFYAIGMHFAAGSKERLRTLQRAMEFSPDAFIIDAYLTEACIQKNLSAELGALEARVDSYFYPGERRDAAIKAYIRAVKNHHVTGKAAQLAEKYADEVKSTD